MQKGNYKGKVIKRTLGKGGLIKVYSSLQYSYCDELEADPSVEKYDVNIPIEIDLGNGGMIYTTDFLIECKGEKKVMECIEVDKLLKPRTAKLLQASYDFWTAKGYVWGIITNGSKPASD